MSRTADFALDSRRFIALHRVAVLSTHSQSMPGYPFGSLTPYDLDTKGNLYIYVSLIAEHYKNINADAKACLTIIDPFGRGDRQAFARASVLCNFEKVAAEDVAAVQASYEARFPNSINYEIAHNFLFLRGRVERVRWIGGFGDIGWVSAEKYLAAGHDPIAYDGLEAIEHMNLDHQAALADVVSSQTKYNAKKQQLQMVGIDQEAMTIAIYAGTERELLRVPFAQPLNSADEIRAAVIAVVDSARGKTA